MTAAETVERVRVGRFAWERRLRDSPEVERTALLVLLVLGSWMDADGARARPGHALLSSNCGLQERAVRAHLAWACEAGWLELVRRGHRRGDGSVSASEYAATVPTSTGVTVPVESPSSTGTNMPEETSGTNLNRHAHASQPARPRYEPRGVVGFRGSTVW